MAELNVIRLNGGKAYPKGAKPNSISYQWEEADGDPVDMTSGVWAGQARAEAVDGTAAADLGSGSIALNTGTATISYAWHTDDFAEVGVFRLILWAGNGTIRYGSAVFEWAVADSPGNDPTV